jgi:hypothetical protein
VPRTTSWYPVLAARGFHPIEVVFFQATGPAKLRLEVSTPGSAKQPVLGEWFAH